ncbi:Shedu anti-phage system protein SduA domain-containing protein [Elizabethkingia miricola]|uniref:Shedu anti-phage system protein SduA domain-containing protein n=1 Tax=Elizabethkingia miricola TaxID=172045 RepID=UPI00389175B9
MYHFDELTIEQKEKFKEFKKITNSLEIDIEAWCKITDENPFLWHTNSYFPDHFLDDSNLKNTPIEYRRYINDLKLIIENTNSTEREILNFLSNEKLFIVAAILKNFTLFGHHDRYIFKEFELPPHHICDYLIIGKNSHGYNFLLIEFENIYNNVTISDGDFGTTIRKGLNQIDDWKSWMDKNFHTFSSSLKRFKNRYEALPDEFNDYDSTRFIYCVVAGRRGDYKEKTYRKVRELSKQNIILTHYDKLLEEAEFLLNSGSY